MNRKIKGSLTEQSMNKTLRRMSPGYWEVGEEKGTTVSEHSVGRCKDTSQ